MGFEIPIDSDYFKHPKTLKLVAILGPRADVFPLRLWAWCSQFAHDGRIRCGKAALEVALGWGRPKGRLHSALVNVGFLESDGETVHDWMQGVGRAILIYDKKKQKQRDKYHLSVGILPEELRKNVGSIPPTLSTLDSQLKTTQEGIQKSGPRPVERILAATWNQGPGLHLNGDKAAEHISAAIHVGVDAQAIEQAFLHHGNVKGKKIWEVLDPLRKQNGNGFTSWDTVLENWKNARPG